MLLRYLYFVDGSWRVLELAASDIEVGDIINCGDRAGYVTALHRDGPVVVLTWRADGTILKFTPEGDLRVLWDSNARPELVTSRLEASESQQVLRRPQA